MDQKVAYLTFDDGPSLFTPKFLNLLNKEGIKATFFVCGKNVERYPEILKKVSLEGHTIGNHSYNHSKMLTCLGLWSEISKTNKAIKKVLGFEPKLYRAPYGEFMPWILPYTLLKGMKLVGWNTRGKDWDAITADEIAGNVLSKHSPKLTILLHDGDETNLEVDRSKTVDATETIIKKLRARGYVFSSL